MQVVACRGHKKSTRRPLLKGHRRVEGAITPMGQATQSSSEVNATIDGLTLRTVSEDRPLVLDLSLAEKLGFERPRKIRELIKRWESELGEVCPTVGQTSEKGGRPSTEYWLTEEQALFIVAKSETPKAVEILRFVIDVFLKARRGSPVPVAVPSRTTGAATLDDLLRQDPIPNRAAAIELCRDRYTDRVLRSMARMTESYPRSINEWLVTADNLQRIDRHVVEATSGGVR